MEKKRIPGLLVAMSILLIVCGLLQLLISFLQALAGDVIAIGGLSTGTAEITPVASAIIILAIASGVVELLMGIFGLRGQQLAVCLVMSLVVIVLALSRLFMAAEREAGALPSIGGMDFFGGPIVSLVLSGLYLLGVIMAMQMNRPQPPGPPEPAEEPEPANEEE